jgi:VanZ family protein
VTARRAFALATVALACWLSLTPLPPQPPGLPSGSDLVAHLLMHGGVGWALLRAWPSGRGAPVAMLCLAIGLEAGQAPVPGRTLSAADLAMNLLGAGGAWLAMRRAPWLRRR